MVAVADRLPVQVTDTGWGLSPGGLVTALRPVMQHRLGARVGWDGGIDGIPVRLPVLSVELQPVTLSHTDVTEARFKRIQCQFGAS